MNYHLFNSVLTVSWTVMSHFAAVTLNGKTKHFNNSVSKISTEIIVS